MSTTITSQPEASLSDDPNVHVEPNKLARKIREHAWEVLDSPRPDNQFAMTSPTPLAGHCYHCSEAYYHALDDDVREKVTPQQVTVVVDHFLLDGVQEVSHWYLEHDNGEILDLTAEQFTDMGLEVPYDEGRGRGFVPPSPSNPTKELLAVARGEKQPPLERLKR